MDALATVLTALQELADAEQAYRKAYELHGGSDSRTGRAWDLMRRAGAKARVLCRAHATSLEAAKETV